MSDFILTLSGIGLLMIAAGLCMTPLNRSDKHLLPVALPVLIAGLVALCYAAHI